MEPSGSASPPALVVDELTKRYESRKALDALSFVAHPGEIIGLVGPNGAGKTTALRSIAGVLPIQDGRVRICGHDVARDAVGAKRCLGWVPDEPTPFESLSVQEHLEFTARLFRLKDWQERGDSLLALFELDQKRDDLGSQLSRGMRQKLAFACAWLPRPRVVLLDEPLSGLDPRGIRSAKEAIRELAADGTTVILSSHLLELVQELASRILILDGGRLVFLGTMEDARKLMNRGVDSSLEEIFFAATADPEGGPGRREPEMSPEEESSETG